MKKIIIIITDKKLDYLKLLQEKIHLAKVTRYFMNRNFENDEITKS